MTSSFVVTGAARGIGRSVAELLHADGGAVVAVDLDPAALAWTRDQGILAVAGDASDEAVTGRAADLAGQAGTLAGWVNNAAVFRDAWLHEAGGRAVLQLIGANLSPALAGCATAIRRFLAAGTPGAIVNVSSHQAQRAVRGALPYATAKAATEGLTRALAADYGPHGIRVNAVALGSIATCRHQEFLARHPAEAAGITEQLGRLHPLGRAGEPEEAAAAIAYLLSPGASFINGAVLPVDGGRAAVGQDPEQA
ncbi:MAG: SDR family oxidoreductase [Nocardiopsaceae bacterium]|nr:SDR family oxidoreductase [Nocardiopsaceae bacterium]